MRAWNNDWTLLVAGPAFVLLGLGLWLTWPMPSAVNAIRDLVTDDERNRRDLWSIANIAVGALLSFGGILAAAHAGAKEKRDRSADPES
jgi:hypothetical protein